MLLTNAHNYSLLSYHHKHNEWKVTKNEEQMLNLSSFFGLQLLDGDKHCEIFLSKMLSSQAMISLMETSKGINKVI